LLEKEKKALLEQQKREKKLEEIESSSWLNRCEMDWRCEPMLLSILCKRIFAKRHSKYMPWL